MQFLVALLGVFSGIIGFGVAFLVLYSSFVGFLVALNRSCFNCFTHGTLLALLV